MTIKSFSSFHPSCDIYKVHQPPEIIDRVHLDGILRKSVRKRLDRSSSGHGTYLDLKFVNWHDGPSPLQPRYFTLK